MLSDAFAIVHLCLVCTYLSNSEIRDPKLCKIFLHHPTWELTISLACVILQTQNIAHFCYC